VDILAVIGRLLWRRARPKDRWGRPQVPHEYTVRSPQTEADYVALFTAIQGSEVFERYSGRRKRYLYPGDGNKYWAMTTSIAQSTVLNRMRIEDDLDRLRREGQI
jgi:hypothetical protein